MLLEPIEGPIESELCCFRNSFFKKDFSLFYLSDDTVMVWILDGV